MNQFLRMINTKKAFYVITGAEQRAADILIERLTKIGYTLKDSGDYYKGIIYRYGFEAYLEKGDANKKVGARIKVRPCERAGVILLTFETKTKDTYRWSNISYKVVENKLIMEEIAVRPPKGEIDQHDMSGKNVVIPLD